MATTDTSPVAKALGWTFGVGALLVIAYNLVGAHAPAPARARRRTRR